MGSVWFNRPPPRPFWKGDRMFIIGKLVGLFADWGLPEPLRKIAAWITVLVAIAALVVVVKSIYDANVIDEHEDQRAIESIEARDEAAEQRAEDTIKNAETEREANEAINSVPAGDAQLRLDCLRLHRLGRDPEPCRRYRGD